MMLRDDRYGDDGTMVPPGLLGYHPAGYGYPGEGGEGGGAGRGSSGLLDPLGLQGLFNGQYYQLLGEVRGDRHTVAEDREIDMTLCRIETIGGCLNHSKLVTARTDATHSARRTAATRRRA